MTFFPPLRTLAIAAATLAPPFFSSCDDGSKSGTGEVGEPQASHQQAPITTAKLTELVKHDSGAVTYKGDLFSGRAIERGAHGAFLREHH